MPTKIIMPQLGESVVEGTISKWLKAEGATVQEMDALLEVNTDKVDTEIPSPAAGTLLKILVPEGETVRAGTIIAWVGQPGETLPGEAGQSGAGTAQPAKAAEVNEPGASESAEAIQETAADPAVGNLNQAPAPSAASNGGNGQSAAREPGTGSVPARSREMGFISPIVARLAQEHNIDLTQVPGTGEGGRITKKDVLAYLEQQSTAQTEPANQRPAPEIWETPGPIGGDLFRPTEEVFGKQTFKGKTEPVRVSSKPAESRPEEAGAMKQADAITQAGAKTEVAKPVAPEMPGEGQILPLSAMRRKIAEHMVISERTSPHVTTVMEADLHRMVAHFNANKDAFAQSGAKLTYTPYFIAATVQALHAVPLVNSSWTEEGILIHPRINIGLAVSLGDEGLIVPVLKGADALSLLGLARAVGDLAGRARGHKLQPEDVREGTFTITNHGISGSLFATPIINQPQCGILGVGAIQKRVVVVEDAAGGDTIAIRPMVYLSLTFDHRILDGASADAFLSKVVQVLEDWP